MRILSNLLAFFFICCSVEGQVSFITECNAKSVSAGSTFTITFRLNNAEGSNFTPPDFKGFEVVNGPMRSMQSSFVNGVGTSSMGFVYTLMATTQGEFTIKPATIIVAGKKLLSTSYTVKVVKQDASKNSSQKEYFILASLDTDNAYIGQQVILTYKLYTSTSIDNIEIVSQPNLDKFSSQNFTLVQEPVITEVYKGKQYNSKLLIKKAIFPLLSGNLKIDPTKFRLTINTDEDPFGFSFSTFGNTKMDNISTNSLELQVDEIPTPIPANFSGAVGQFNVLFSTINNTYSLSDAIPVEITISGNGNFSTLKPEL
ncbi:MAG: BatD family protein, partial [Saprospiraceae bacterium]